MKTVTVHGHFGEYVQGRMGPGGPLALITVPCPKTGLHAWRRPGAGNGAGPLGGFLKALDLAGGGEIVVSPFSPPGAGTGISTATLIAAARLHGWRGPPGRLMAACVAHEGASDPLAFPRPGQLLWASREAVILERTPALPPHDIVGGYFGKACPTDPRDRRFPDVSDIVRDWKDARHLRRFGELASESARRCLRMRGPAGDPTECLARSLGASGFLIAHTGSARGLMFPRGKVPPEAVSALQAAGLTGVFGFRSDDC